MILNKSNTYSRECVCFPEFFMTFHFVFPSGAGMFASMLALLGYPQIKKWLWKLHQSSFFMASQPTPPWIRYPHDE